MTRPPVKFGHRSAPLRILFVMDRLHETGGTLYYLQMLPRLDPARVTPFLCAFAPWHPIADRFAAAGIRPTFFGRARWDPRCVLDLVRFARSCNPDLIHLEGHTSFLLGRLGVHLTRRPAMLRFNNMLAPSQIKALVNRWLIPSTWPAVAVSEAVRRWSMQEFGIPPDRIRVLHTALDVDRFAAPRFGARDRIRGEFTLGADTPILGLVGRLDVAQKGQDVMIRAMATLRARRRDAVLLIAGDGPDREKCEALVRQLGLGEVVRFAGHRSDVPDVLAAVDVAVVPSMCEEASPFAALEASAAGRPVVAFESGGLPEVVLHDQTGIIVPKGDVAGLVAAVTTLLDDPGLAMRLGEGGRRHASRFSLSGHVAELMGMFEALVDDHRRSKGRSSGPWRDKPTC